MTHKFEVLAEFAKDISFETPDVEAFLKTKENISKYNLNIDINSKPLKNKLIEVNIMLKFYDRNMNNKGSNIEITYAVIVRVDDNVNEKKELETSKIFADLGIGINFGKLTQKKHIQILVKFHW